MASQTSFLVCLLRRMKQEVEKSKDPSRIEFMENIIFEANEYITNMRIHSERQACPRNRAAVLNFSGKRLEFWVSSIILIDLPWLRHERSACIDATITRKFLSDYLNYVDVEPVCSKGSFCGCREVEVDAKVKENENTRKIKQSLDRWGVHDVNLDMILHHTQLGKIIQKLFHNTQSLQRIVPGSSNKKFALPGPKVVSARTLRPRVRKRKTIY